MLLLDPGHGVLVGERRYCVLEQHDLLHEGLPHAVDQRRRDGRAALGLVRPLAELVAADVQAGCPGRDEHEQVQVPAVMSQA